MVVLLQLHASIYEGSVIGAREVEIPDVPVMNDTTLTRAASDLLASDAKGLLVTATVQTANPQALEYWPEPGAVIGSWKRD